MEKELEKIEKVLKRISQIIKESQEYWQGEAGEYHRAYLLQWYKESMELVTKIRKEQEYGR